MPNLPRNLLAILLLAIITSFTPKPASETPVYENTTANPIATNSLKSAFVPTFSNCPSDITGVTPNAGDCTAVVSWTPPTATGNGPVTVSSNYSPGDSFYPGTHRVIYRATDVDGTSFCEFIVEVEDNEPTVITVPADITVAADPGSCGAVVTFPYPTATDNCPAGEGAPIDENFDSGTDLSTLCYDFDGSFIGTGGNINGSAGELETVELINNDIRSFTTPLTRFNGTGEIFFDHRILAGSPSGNIGNNARLTVKLITQGGVETIIFSEQYIDENVQTEYIPITQSGNFYVQFEWETDQNRSDIAYLEDLYIPGYVIADTTVVTCGVAQHRVVQVAGQPYRSGREFPVGTTTLEYIARDATGKPSNIGFASFQVTVTNNISPPAGSNVEYCEGTPIPELSVTVGAGETADWYDAAVGGTLLQADSNTYQPLGPGTYYAETRNTTTGCVSSTRTPITLTENPRPTPPTSASPLEYCIGDTATQLTASGDPGNSIEWYDAPTNGNLINPAPTPDTSTAGTTSYFVQQTDPGTGCSSLRTQVDVIVYALPSAPTVTSPLEYCIGDTADQLDDSATGTNLTWYDAPTGGNVIPGTFRPSTTTAGTQNYWVSQTAGSGSINCESTRSQLTVNVSVPPTVTSNPSNQTICPGSNTSFTATASDAASYQWQLFNGTTWDDLVDNPPYSNTSTTTLNITGASLAMNSNRYRMVASSAAATCGNVISSDATLTVEDNTDPVLSGCPVGPLTANSTSSSCGAAITWTPPTATDDCGLVTITSNGYTPGDEFLPGTTTVIYTATDAAGNTDTCSFDVIVTDNIDPVITGPANTTVQADNAGCTAIVNYADPTATDNCVMSTGTYPVRADFEEGDRQLMRNECWQFWGATIQNSSPFSPGTFSFRSQQIINTESRTLVSPLTYFNGTGQISFEHRLENTVGDNTRLTVSMEDEGGTITPIFTYVYVDTNLHDVAIDVAQSGNYRIRFDFDTDGTNDPNRRTRMDNLIIPGIDLSDTSDNPLSQGVCAKLDFNVVQTGGLASGSAFPVGTTTNTYEVTDAYGNTGTYSFDVTVENNLTVTANATDTEICEGDSITLTGSGAQSYAWDNGVTDGVPFTINSTTTFTVTGTDANGCQDTDSITITVNANPTIAVTSAPACSLDLSTYSLSVSVSDGTLTSSEGTVTNSGGNNWTISDVTSGNNIVLTTTDTNGCQGTLNITAPNCSCPTVNAPTSGGNQTQCEQNPIQTLTATATPPSGANVVWYDAATGGNTVASPTLNTVGSITYHAESVDTVNGCTSSTRTAVTLTIQGVPASPTSGGNQTQCAQSPVQTLTATATPPSGSSIIWFDAPSGGNTIASPTLGSVGTTTYYAESRDNGTGCSSHSRTAVTLTINDNPTAPVSGGDQTQCETSPVQTLTATATPPAGSNIVWFDAATGGNTVASPTLNAVGTVTYYAESQDGSTGCTSNSRTAVSLTIQDTPDISISGGPACAPDLLTYEVSVNVSEGTVTSTEGTVTDNGSNNWTISGITSGNDITLTVTASNSCTQTLPITAPNCSCPIVAAPTSSGDQTECAQSPVQTLTATATPPANATIVWYDAASGGNVVASPTLSTIGTVTYFAESVQNITNCVSSTRTAVSLTIQQTPADPVSGGDQIACDANPTQTLTATATAPTGSSIIWYDAASGGNIVASPTLSSVGTITYYAESSDTTTSCRSFNRIPVQLTINPLPPVVANASTTTINAGEPVTLTGSGANTYAWDNGVNDGDTVFPLTTTTYTVTGTDGNGCENTDSITITVGATSDLRLEKTVDFAAPNVGDTVTFTVSVTNDGPSDDAGGSVVHDALPTGYTYIGDNSSAANGTYNNATGNWTLPTLSNGSSVSIAISATVDAPTGATSEYLNIAQITAATNYDNDSAPNNDDGDQSEDDEAGVSVTPQVSDLSVSNTILPASANPGDTVIVSVEISNGGTDDATNVALENIVPTGFNVATINNGGLQTGNTIAWSGLNIPSGTTSSLTYEATVNMPAGNPNEYLNTVQVTQVDQFDPDSMPNNDDGDQSEDDEDNVLLVLQSADLEVVNSVTPASGNPGDTLTFTVEVSNTGTDEATGVVIENNVPSGFTLTNINNGGLQTGNIISWSGLNIPASSTTTLTFEVTINVPTNTPGEYINTVQVADVDQLDPDSTPNNDDGDQSEDDEDRAEIVLIPADLNLTKALSATSNQTPNAGDTVVFELVLTNEGPGIATNVTIEDVLPTGYILEAVNNGGSVSGNTISWNIPNMPVGIQTLSYEVSLNPPTNSIGEYTNIAQVSASDQFDPDSAPNNDDGDQSEDDEARYTINAPTVDLEINKDVDKLETFHEDTVVFTVTVSNNSAYEATNIGIEDVLPSGYILVSHEATLGFYDEAIATWEIPSIAIGETAALQMTATVTDIDDYTNIAQLIYVDQIDPNINNDRAEVTPQVTQSSCLTVFNEFSPNNDGANDFFFIECIEQYPNSTLTVFNRWGTMVFTARNYDNTWDGTSANKGTGTIGASEKLPVGTYYYTLEPGDGQTTPKTGWLYISR